MLAPSSGEVRIASPGIGVGAGGFYAIQAAWESNFKGVALDGVVAHLLLADEIPHSPKA